MRKFTVMILTILLGTGTIFAGGLVHNTNQSAAWSRMLSRSATLEIDGVYFNPAGLVKLEDGFHISANSQTIWQDKPITSTFPYLNHETFDGKVSAPVFPSVYFAYKTGKWAFSAGFFPMGGGGSAVYSKGIPTMEIPIAALVPTFSTPAVPGAPSVTGYSVDMQFEGSSIYWGIQAGVSYAITDNISVYAGLRQVIAVNHYTGYIRDITLETTEGDIRADVFMGELAGEVATLAAGATATGESMTPIIDAGYGELTWDQAVAYGVLSSEQVTAMQTGLVGLGFTQDEVNAMDMAVAQQSFYGGAEVLNAKSAQLEGGAYLMGDQEGDITQTGTGLTPLIGANFNFFNSKLNIGLKYEFETKMDLTNDVPDGKGFAIGIDAQGNTVYMFPDGEKTNADIPAMFSAGLDYQIIDPLKISLSYHNYFDKNVEWAEENGVQEIDNNYWEMAVGLEYNINEKFLVSAGYLHAHTGVNQNYQSDLSYSLTSNTFALGGAYKINDMLRVNAGAYLASYEKKTYEYDYTLMDGTTTIPYTDSYEKETIAFAVGLDITIANKKKK